MYAYEAADLEAYLSALYSNEFRFLINKIFRFHDKLPANFCQKIVEFQKHQSFILIYIQNLIINGTAEQSQWFYNDILLDYCGYDDFLDFFPRTFDYLIRNSIYVCNGTFLGENLVFRVPITIHDLKSMRNSFLIEECKSQFGDLVDLNKTSVIDAKGLYALTPFTLGLNQWSFCRIGLWPTIPLPSPTINPCQCYFNISR